MHVEFQGHYTNQAHYKLGIILQNTGWNRTIVELKAL